MTEEEFEDAITGIHIDFGKFAEAEEYLMSLHRRAPNSRVPMVIFLTGDPGSGKSTVGERIEQQIQAIRAKETDINAAYVQCSSGVTYRGLLGQILRAIRHADPFKGTQAELEDKLIQWAPKVNLRMLLLDEAQHLVSMTNERKNSAAADLIKVIANQLRAVLVLVGTSEVTQLVNEKANPKKDHLHRRLRRRFNLDAFGFSSQEDQDIYCAFLELYDEALPFDLYCGFSEPEFAAALYGATSGLPGWLVQLVIYAGELVFKERGRRIEPRHLKSAWLELRAPELPGQPNPFSNLKAPKPRRKQRNRYDDAAD